MRNKRTDYYLVMQHGITKLLRAIPVIIILMIFGFSESAFAQDLLILKSGKELKVNIVEEGSDIIKYREFDNPTGPLYSVTKDKVAEVKYKKGGRETQPTNIKEPVKPFTEIPVQDNKSNVLTTTRRNVYLNGVVQAPRNVRLLMEDQPEALKSYESGKKLFTASNICPLAIMVISFAASKSIQDMPEQEDKTRVGIIVLSIDGALIISGILFSSMGKKRLRNSVSLYNSAQNKPVPFSLRFGLQENGVGVALKF